MSDIGYYYGWEVTDHGNECEHRHRSMRTAVVCAQRAIRLAQRGRKFWHSEYLLQCDPDTLEYGTPSGTFLILYGSDGRRIGG